MRVEALEKLVKCGDIESYSDSINSLAIKFKSGKAIIISGVSENDDDIITLLYEEVSL